MLYPAQTSFIPVTVAITSFVEKHGFGGLYPFWYLGSTPVKYLTGPAVPSLLIALHRLFGSFSLFDLSYFTLITSHLILSFGWGLLAWYLSGKRSYGFIVSLFVLLAPWHWVSSLGLGEVSTVLAQAFTPWVLLAFVWNSVHFLKKRSTEVNFDSVSDNSVSLKLPRAYNSDIKSDGKSSARSVMFLRKFLSFSHVNCYPFGKLRVTLSLLKGQVLIVSCLLPAVVFALLLLTNITASIPAIIGLIILGLVMYKRWEQGLKRIALVIFIGWILTLWWYPPNYWLTLLIAPSIGGSSAAGALIHLVNLMRGFVPVILAIIVVTWGARKMDAFGKFVVAWFGVFGLLTLFRFFGDPKFWLDWISWMGEVEIGLVLLLVGIFRSSRFIVQSSKLSIYYLLFTIYLIFGWFFAYQNRSLWLPRKSIENTVEYKIANWLSNNLTMKQFNNSPVVFLSGSTAFWLNSFYDIRQVRGGVDQVSWDPYWRQAAWEIREGATTEGTEKVLKALKINYIVVHTEQSDEYYHDFKYPEKFDRIPSLKKVYEQEGDMIYKIE